MSFDDIVRNYIAIRGDIDDTLDNFYSSNYIIIKLRGDGVIAYTDEGSHYFIWFTYIDNKITNAKRVYNIAKELSLVKPVRYTGVKDFYHNNSIDLGQGIYQIKI